MSKSQKEPLKGAGTPKTEKSKAENNQRPAKGQAFTSMATLFEEKVVEEKPPHPFDAVFGEKVNTQIQTSVGAETIGLNYQQFREIQWPNVLPNFICDLIELLSGFNMRQELVDRAGRKNDEDKQLIIQNKIKQEKEKSPAGHKPNEKTIRDRLEKELGLLSDKERALKEAKEKLGVQTYNALYQFFDFMKYNTNETNQSRSYLTEGSILKNLHKYFGHKTLFLDERLYYMLSKGQKNTRIYFD